MAIIKSGILGGFKGNIGTVNGFRTSAGATVRKSKNSLRNKSNVTNLPQNQTFENCVFLWNRNKKIFLEIANFFQVPHKELFTRFVQGSLRYKANKNGRFYNNFAIAIDPFGIGKTDYCGQAHTNPTLAVRLGSEGSYNYQGSPYFSRAKRMSDQSLQSFTFKKTPYYNNFFQYYPIIQFTQPVFYGMCGAFTTITDKAVTDIFICFYDNT